MEGLVVGQGKYIVAARLCQRLPEALSDRFCGRNPSLEINGLEADY